jgi:hypothetical protein
MCCVLELSRREIAWIFPIMILASPLLEGIAQHPDRQMSLGFLNIVHHPELRPVQGPKF